MYIQWRGLITITSCYRDDATQPHTQEMHRLIQTYEIARKDQLLNVHGRNQTICQKRKKLETLIQAVRIYSQVIGMEFGIASNEKR